MSPPFSGGVSINYPHGRKCVDGQPREKPAKYLLVRAGPQRGRYVHDLIMEAKLGRLLERDETVEHKDGNGLNVDPDNLIVVTKRVNTHLRHQREQRARRLEMEAAGQAELTDLVPWQEQF